jgi:hypothetical protein
MLESRRNGHENDEADSGVIAGALYADRHAYVGIGSWNGNAVGLETDRCTGVSG